MKELVVFDVVKCMVWVGDFLCLGIKCEYVIFNIFIGVSFDVFFCGRYVNLFVVLFLNGDLLFGKVYEFYLKYLCKYLWMLWSFNFCIMFLWIMS